MDTFSITCTTCNSRLKVQSLSAIGEILACPKCQSMVKVEPPEGWSPPAQLGATNETEVPCPPQQSESKETSQDTIADENAPLLPNAAWTSASSRKKLTIAAVAAVALLLGLGVVAIGRALVKDSSEGDKVAESGDNHSEPTPKADGSAPVVESGVQSPQPIHDAEREARHTTASKNPVNAGEHAASESPVKVAPSRVDPLSDGRSSAGPTEKADLGSPKTPDGPPGLVAKSEDKSPDDSDLSGPSLLAELDRFSELIDDPTLVGGSSEAATAEDVLTPGDVPDEDLPLPRPATREVDVAARLGDPLPGIEFTDVSLSVFVRFVSDFSTIPVSIEPEALVQRQITLQTPVSIRRTDTTVGQVLRDVFSSRGLRFLQRDNQLVIVAAATPEPDSPREVEYELSDLSSGSADDAKRIAAWITALIRPKTWQVNGGSAVLEVKGTTLTIRQSEAIHFQILTLCEKLRVARGLSTRSSYPAELFQLESRSANIAERLERSISMNYLDDARFVEILERAQDQSGVNILVDWHALAEAGWNPDARFPFSVDKKPLHEMLTRLLKRMNLTYRVVDSNTVQITTDKRLMSLAEVEFYRVDDLISERTTAEELIEVVTLKLGEVHFLDHAGAICLDPKSRYLIVAVPQPQQQAVARILAGLRKRGSDASE